MIPRFSGPFFLPEDLGSTMFSADGPNFLDADHLSASLVRSVHQVRSLRSHQRDNNKVWGSAYLQAHPVFTLHRLPTGTREQLEGVSLLFVHLDAIR